MTSNNSTRRMRAYGDLRMKDVDSGEGDDRLLVPVSDTIQNTVSRGFVGVRYSSDGIMYVRPYGSEESQVAIAANVMPKISGGTPGNYTVIDSDGETIKDGEGIVKTVADSPDVVVQNPTATDFELGLTTTGIDSGTYTRITVDAKGRVSTGSTGKTGVYGGGYYLDGLLVSETWLNYIAALSPIFWWRMDELSGTVATNYGSVSSADGTYQDITLNNADGPALVGGRAGLWDPALKPFCNFATSNALANFPIHEGSVFILAKMANAGVWTDGTTRHIFRAYLNATNRVVIEKGATNNLIYRYYANTSEEYEYTVPTPDTNWFSVCMTWSDAGNDNELKYYFNGTQVGTTFTGNGVFAGQPLTFLAGADTHGGSSDFEHSGNLYQCLLVDRVLSATEIELMSVIA